MKTKNANQLKIGAILTYLSMGFGIIISLIYTPTMIRLLGQNEYGLYNLAASVIAYLGVLNFGFGSTYIKYYSMFKKNNNEEDISKLNGMFLIIFSIIAVFALVSGIILSFYAEFIFGNELTDNEVNTASTLLIILTINLAIKFPNIVFVSYIRANEHFIFQKLVDFSSTLLNPFFIIPVLYLGYGSIGMAIVITVISIIVEVLHMTYSFKKLNISFKLNSFDVRLFKEMTIFSSFIFLNMVIDQINWNVDKFIIGRFHGTASVAVYSLGATINSQYRAIAMAVSSVFVPRIHRMINNSTSYTELTLLFTKVGRIQFIILVFFLSGFIIFGKPFILWWAGKEYYYTYYIISILLTTATISVVQSLGIEIQRAMNLHKFRSVVYLIIAISNIVISIPLVSLYNGVGAAIGTGISYIIANGIIMNMYYYKRIGLNIGYFWFEIIKIIPAIILPVFSGIVLWNLFDLYNFFYFSISILIYIILFVLSMWFFGLNDGEKLLIKKPVKKIYNILIKN
jgi:O-antigen/teichoic acid export membrane protein